MVYVLSSLKIRILSIGLLLLALSCRQQQVEVDFEVEADDTRLGESPVSLTISPILPANFELFHEGKQIPFQKDSANQLIWFMHNSNGSNKYTIKERVQEKDSKTEVKVTKKNGNLALALHDKPLVTYRYDMTYPPKGVDSLFRKSGYIHPVLAPNGDTLSRIQPPDHYHHYGIWGPWTHTQISGQQVDFWNLGDGKGTVLFKKFNNTTSGPVFAGFNAQQEHWDLLTQKEPQIAINEHLKVTLWDLGRKDRYMLDYCSNFSSPLEEGILFEAYRYGGGLGMRFTERWYKDNCDVITSEGKDRVAADGTNARWCMVTGESANGKGTNGILFMSHPNNRQHPEPMRVWPIDANDGRGDMFFEFTPIRHKEWQIDPGKKYTLQYRMVVFDGKLTTKEAEAYWQAFAHPLTIEALTK